MAYVYFKTNIRMDGKGSIDVEVKMFEGRRRHPRTDILKHILTQHILINA